MEDLYYNLAQEEFSKGRKILLWILAILLSIVTLVVIYMKYVKYDPNTTIGLIITLGLITSFLFLIAILSTARRKEHFFRVDSETISYHYGLLFPSHHTYKWEEIKHLYFPPHSKKTTLILQDGKVIHINLTWVEKNKSRNIRKHIFYSAKNKGVQIQKTNYKK